MRNFSIAAISAASILALPVGQSQALTIRPVTEVSSSTATLLTEVRHRGGGRAWRHHGGGKWRHGNGGRGGRHYGYRGHGGHYYGGADWWWAVPAIGLGLSVLANPYYYPQPQYVRPIYRRPYYNQRCGPTDVNCSDGTKPPYYNR